MKWLSKKILNALGWTLVGQRPEQKKYVIIFAPHTSNWDVVLLLLVRSYFKLAPKFIGKHTLFWPPLSWFLRSIGGSPVDRNSPHNVVSQIVDKFREHEEFALALSPEGTRSKKEYWKTGFYRIAVLAKVPIQFSYLDIDKKEIGLGPLFFPTGDINKDFQVLKSFYGNKRGIRPELLSTIKVQDENNKAH